MDLYERIFVSMPDAMIVSDRSGQVVAANAHFETLFGYTRAELIGRDLDLLITGGTQAFDRIPTGGPFKKRAGVARRKDGSTMAVEMSSTPFRDSEGFVDASVLIVRDESETGRSPAAPDPHQTRMQAVFEAGVIGMSIASPERRFLEINDALASMLGYPREELIGRTWEEFTHPEDVAESARLVDRVLAGSIDTYRLEKRYVRSDGQVIHAAVAGRAVRDEDGRVRYLAVLVQDITERKRAEQALRASEKLLRLVVDHVPSMIAYWNPDLRCRFANQAYRQWFGFKPEDMVGTHIRDVLGPELYALNRPHLEAALRGEGQTFERVIVRPDGDVRYTLAFYVPDPSIGEVQGILAQIIDVTTLKAAEESLRAEAAERERVNELLRRSTASLQEAQRLAQIGSWELDHVKRTLTWSEEVYRIFETAPPEFAESYEDFLQAVHPEDRERVDSAYSASVTNRTPYEIEHRLRMKDGRIKHVHERGRTEYDQAGQAARSIGTVQDVTERREVDLLLRENEAMLAAVIHSSSDAVITTDVKGLITRFNPAAERIFRRPASTMLGRGVEILLPRHARPHHPQSIADFAASHVASRNMSVGRVQGLRADGVLLELESSISQVTINNKQMLTAILRDVTERVHNEYAMVKHQLELTELTHQLLAQEKATASRLAQALHDQLGQTLTAIRINFVSETLPADASQAARHGLVDQLIDQAVAEVRQVIDELRPTLLSEFGLLEALDNELRTRQKSAQSVLLRLEAPPELGSQRWSADVEYAAFMIAREAITNALQHAGANIVRVVLDGDARRLHLEIVDNGLGFAPGALAARPGHLGLVGMRERSIAIGARFEIQSLPGGGAAVRMNWEEGQT
jgi:PAS domain S-box-containing protein